MKKTKTGAIRRRNFLLYSYGGLLVLILLISITSMLRQKVFATTYVINDGDRVMTYTTMATDPAEILDRAGVALEEHDTYTTDAEGGEATITVSRGQRVTVHDRGKTVMVTSYGETVGQLLQRLGMELTDEDVLSHDQLEGTFDGMELSINRIITRRETFSAAVSHETQYCADASLPVGAEKVLIPGRDGELLRTADVTYTNGTETHRRILSETVLRKPVPETVAVGSGDWSTEEAVPVIRDGYILLPTGELLTYTHTDTVEATAYTHTDKGCDLVTSTGTTVRWGTVAVDPTRIPYGTRMFIMANDGSYVYGIATAEDCGGDIKGDRMDLYYPTFQECIQFGRRVCTIYFLG